MDNHTLRIIDANFNRAREGLRVVEEYSRFVLNDRALTERLKKIRHGLKEAVGNFVDVEAVKGGLSQFRDTPGDVGTSVTIASEQLRDSAVSVALASMKRLQESLRVLEEYGKVDASGSVAGGMLERLRYESYAVESLLFCARSRKERLSSARLYVLITESLASVDAEVVCREAVSGGADVIQMREKNIEDGEFILRAEKMCDICREGGTLFFVNDRPHIAQLVDADGIHTGQGDLPVHLSRRIIGYDRIIGRSTSAPEFADAAVDDGADYIGVGPVYETNTKQHRAPVGLEYVHWAAEHSRLPYFCIGSINRDTLGGVLEAGAFAVAVCTAIINAKDIAAETAWFKETIVASGV